VGLARAYDGSRPARFPCGGTSALMRAQRPPGRGAVPGCVAGAFRSRTSLRRREAFAHVKHWQDRSGMRECGALLAAWWCFAGDNSDPKPVSGVSSDLLARVAA